MMILRNGQHGPVVNSLYSEYKQYGYDPLPIPREELDLNRFSPEVCQVLDTVNAVYGVFSATQLRNMTHMESPWLQTIDGAAITYQKMKAYFEPLVQGAPSESIDELQGQAFIDAMISCPELAEEDKIARSNVASVATSLWLKCGGCLATFDAVVSDLAETFLNSLNRKDRTAFYCAVGILLRNPHPDGKSKVFLPFPYIEGTIGFACRGFWMTYNFLNALTIQINTVNWRLDQFRWKGCQYD